MFPTNLIPSIQSGEPAESRSFSSLQLRHNMLFRMVSSLDIDCQGCGSATFDAELWTLSVQRSRWVESNRPLGLPVPKHTIRVCYGTYLCHGQYCPYERLPEKEKSLRRLLLFTLRNNLRFLLALGSLASFCDTLGLIRSYNARGQKV
jgi:hypothetical protein